MKKIFMTLCFLTSLTMHAMRLSSGFECSTFRKEEVIERVNEALRSEDYNEAKTLIREWNRKCPHNPILTEDDVKDEAMNTIL